MPRGKAMRKPNGYGTVVKLSGNRRRPFEVRVNTRIDEWGFPRYDVLERFEQRIDAEIALAEYNRNPFDINKRYITFREVYDMWYEWKYIKSAKTYSKSTISCTKCAFNKCSSLYSMKFKEIRTDDMQRILDDHTLSHAYMEHILNLLHQMYKYALEYDIIEKDYSSFVKITKADDDEAGIPFSKDDIAALWKNVDKVPYCDTVLILIYTGWRITEFLEMQTKNINITEWTMQGGIKTAAGKNRIVPIHSSIKKLILNHYSTNTKFYLAADTKPNTHISNRTYYDAFQNVMEQCEITEKHTPHDCRHTFTSLLNSAGANDVCIDRLVGHTSKTLTKKTYTHKDIDELRQAVELIKIEPLG